ncbi:alpha-ketoglutarate-dependent dioxygenase AlkB family protein [Aliidiomarina indica]|uniref:alpha-ketoglutarate-dependent dioxygenase AlkB family protein n=1 Tax=Aliidiomarina indica TaxID=2749147 RepID=UPI00188EB2A6|nr:alpha-ketoglutarate-dependent dioxygenase AlkB [Aliidiomarina indica]
MGLKLESHRLRLPDSTLYYVANWCDARDADRLFDSLRTELPWQQGDVKLFGKVYKTPRLQSWHGDTGIRYTYSNVELQAHNWTPSLSELRNRLLSLDIETNSVLANFYRDGKDSMGWHRDNEPELGKEPLIASVSLGAERDFILRHRGNQQRHVIRLEHGSLLIMAGTTQHYWEHALPKRMRVDTPRINLTFRQIKR